MRLMGCLAWSAGDLCNGKKDATYILAQDVRKHTHYPHSLQICASGYKSVEENKLLLVTRNVYLLWFLQLLCMCQNSQRSSLCLLYGSVNNTSHHGVAVTHWPESLKCKCKYINVSMHAGRRTRVKALHERKSTSAHRHQHPNWRAF